MPSLASLSPAVTDIYFFRGVESPASFRPEATRFWRVEDAAGGFIPADAWANTAEQRRAMLDYPVAALNIASVDLEPSRKKRR